MKLSLFLLAFALIPVNQAQAEIYKRVDSSGHVTYSSEPLKGGRKLELKPLPTVPGTRTSNRSGSEEFPRVDSQTQQRRDATRRIILEDELATENDQLESSRQNLQNLTSNPPPIIGADGVPYRNTAQHAESLKAAQDTVALHERNVIALRTEISNLK